MKRSIVLLLCLFRLWSYGQNVELVLGVADQLYNNKDYFGSIVFYEKALHLDSSNATVLYKYAHNLSLINNDRKAVRYYQKALILDGTDQFPTLTYELAEAYRSIGEYRKARQYYNRAIGPYRKDRSSYWYKKIDQSKKSADWANKHKNNAISSPSNLGKVVNSEYSEYGAQIHEEFLFFSALIADSAEEGNRIKDKHYYSRIYKKSLTDSKGATALVLSPPFPPELASKHLANPTFHGKELYFSVCDSTYKCEIWKAQFLDGQIKNPEKLNRNINDPSSNNTQACVVDIDGTTYLFFTSDRKKGIGGLDIWVSKKESFGFDEPINLGTTINSIDNEITPYYHVPTKTLYFSSDWHEGYGKYDVFKSKGKPISFEPIENLGYGINSSFSDYYFVPHDKVATFTSNRYEGNSDQKGNCCSDLFEIAYQTEEESTPELDSSLNSKIVSVEVLNKYLPLSLYFHNDQPNPNSRDTTSRTNYLDLAKVYRKMKEEYLSKYLAILSGKEKDAARDNLEYFFEEELYEGIEELESFMPLLTKELSKGSNIELTVKGFASSISESDYNLNLTLRRIASLINYFNAYENGVLAPYLNGTAENGGSLKINKVPFGEFAVKQQIDEDDKISAIYSPLAIKERKLELVAVTNSFGNSQINTEEQAILSINSNQYHLGSIQAGDQIKRFFNLENTGKAPLKIYSVSANCDCVSFDYPKEIAIGEQKKLWITVNTKELSGAISIKLLVVTNTIHNLNELEVSFTVED